MGIIFHTTYTGKGDLSTYTASFGASVAKLRPSSTCWFDDAFFKGTDIAFTAAEYASIDSHVDSAEKLIGGFDRIISILDGLPSAYAGAHVKVFVNSNIRVGKYPNPKTAFDEYVEFIKKYWEKQIEGVKTEDAKSRKRAELQTLLGQIVSNKAAFVKSFEYINHINHAKLLIIRKINELSKDKMYIKTATGYKVSNPEGFVAIDIKSGAGVKFVDRLEFSYNNFSSEILKGWQK